MVKITNVFGDEYKGRQGNAVYQKKYGKQIRRVWDGKKRNTAPAQEEQKARFRQAHAWIKQLTSEEVEGLKTFVNRVRPDLTWQQYAIKTALDRGKVSITTHKVETTKEVWKADWDAIGWLYRQKITLTNDNSYDLVDYQVKLELDSTKVGANFDWSRQGADLRFYDSNGNKLSYWVESWEEGQAVVWVKVSFIGANSSTDIFMYYGNSSAISESNAEEVFIRVIEGLVGAWHFDEGSGGTAYDSSGNNNHGTIYGATWTDGRYGKALKFDGTNDYVRFSGDVFDFSKYDEFTVLVWAMRTGSGSGGVIGYCPGGSVKRSPGMWFYPSEKDFHWGFGDGSNWLNTIVYGVLDANEWFLLGMRWKYSEGKLEGIVNGEVVGYVNTGTSRPYPNTVYYVGRVDTYHKGLIDQVLIFNRALSDEEIQDLYNNFGYATPNCPGKVLVRKYAKIEPSVAFGTEEYGKVTTSVLVQTKTVTVSHSGLERVEVYDKQGNLLVNEDGLSDIAAGKITIIWSHSWTGDSLPEIGKVVYWSITGVKNEKVV